MSLYYGTNPLDNLVGDLSRTGGERLQIYGAVQLFDLPLLIVTCEVHGNSYLCHQQHFVQLVLRASERLQHCSRGGKLARLGE